MSGGGRLGVRNGMGGRRNPSGQVGVGGHERDERGVVGQVFTLVVVLATVTAAFLVMLQYAAAARQASTAADLSALAGSRAALVGQDACAAAKDVARLNRAVLLSCREEDGSVTVEAAVRLARSPVGLPSEVKARAIAEPAP